MFPERICSPVSNICVLDLRTVLIGIFLFFISLVNFTVCKEYSIEFPRLFEIN